MPLGWERINAKSSAPNKNVVFIKPLSGSDEAISRAFLERIAAQCVPIMNSHYLAVVSLEEYEPNLEFWGRNFNNGEIIQLVLKSPSTGRWLPFKFVQMVMMHELAHCKEMNHSAAFWKVRNEFSSEMRALWEKDYTGDGLWGRGVLLEDGAFTREELDAGELLPEHMCGGTFKSRGGKKRKSKPKITYKERQERHIRKKFGENGVTLGADEQAKSKLEKGKRPAGKPRVAGSSRGRELRAAAALGRLEAKEATNKDEELVTDSGSDNDDEDGDALDRDGKRLLDAKGRGMVRVCEEEDKNDANVKQELEELRTLDFCSIKPSPISNKSYSSTGNGEILKKFEKIRREEDISANIEDEETTPKSPKLSLSGIKELSCPICSVTNDVRALTCSVLAIPFPSTTVSQDHYEVLRLRASTTVDPNAVTGTICGDTEVNIVFHDQNVAELAICGGIAGTIEKCGGAPTSTEGSSGTALFELDAADSGATINISKGRWEGCVRAARAVCPTGEFTSTCVGGASTGDVDFSLSAQ